MKKKLLVVNLQDPHSTCYKNHKTFGVWMWGRRMSNYALFCVTSDGKMTPINLETADVKLIQEQIDKMFN